MNEVSVRCACGHAIMEIVCYDEPGKPASIIFWESYQPSLWQRITKAWGYIIGKRLDAQDFVLYEEDMVRIKQFIEENY